MVAVCCAKWLLTRQRLVTAALSQKTIAAEGCETDDQGQVGTSTAHCDDDSLHHVEVFLLIQWVICTRVTHT